MKFTHFLYSFVHRISISLSVGVVILICFTSCLDDDDNPGPQENALQVLEADGDFSLFLSAMEHAELLDLLSQSLSITVFAPSNSAFTTFLTSEGVSAAEEIPVDELTPILLYQFLPFGLRSTDLQSVYYFSANRFSPDSVAVVMLANITPNAIVFNSQATVTQSDIEAQNGFIHKTDAVLTPPNVLSIIETNPNFSILEEALTITGLADSLISTSPKTLFAPPDGAFEDLFSELPGVNDIDDFPVAELERIIRFHIAEDNFISQELFFNDLTTLLEDKELRVENTGGANISVNLQTAIILPDVQATNGIIHVINDVLDPGD